MQEMQQHIEVQLQVTVTSYSSQLLIQSPAVMLHLTGSNLLHNLRPSMTATAKSALVVRRNRLAYNRQKSFMTSVQDGRSLFRRRLIKEEEDRQQEVELQRQRAETALELDKLAGVRFFKAL
jgi:hypothetical protein